jgi:hypothetical protein
MGAQLQIFLRDMYIHEWFGDHHVLRIQTAPGFIEQKGAERSCRRETDSVSISALIHADVFTP